MILLLQSNISKIGILTKRIRNLTLVKRVAMRGRNVRNRRKFCNEKTFEELRSAPRFARTRQEDDPCPTTLSAGTGDLGRGFRRLRFHGAASRPARTGACEWLAIKCGAFEPQIARTQQ